MEITSLEKIKELLERKPPRENKREQLFWLVDVVYACKLSGSEALVRDAEEVESLVIPQWPPIPDKSITLKFEMSPGAERCGDSKKLACYVQFEPVMNEVASALFSIESKLSFQQRNLGFESENVLTVFGVKPEDRHKVSVKFKVKTANSQHFALYEGRTAEVEWKAEMGIVKAIKIPKFILPRFSMEIPVTTKIEFKMFDRLRTKPSYRKWVFLIAKKDLPINCEIEAVCPNCNIKIKPSPIKLTKGNVYVSRVFVSRSLAKKKQKRFPSLSFYH
jgi:hypothetical protein